MRDEVGSESKLGRSSKRSSKISFTRSMPKGMLGLSWIGLCNEALPRKRVELESFVELGSRKNKFKSSKPKEMSNGGEDHE
ncbi:hypothetical protein CXB51_019426 [Gossypium anomalum]|uniref:Uncharacterized protein n=1 Tax=Gossypium anomalum TaxID=47600 RepID=A0A8J5YAA0_9ROSI|nr:hypothetical protein CXB51_019426 [Gossypium anomalum]